MSESHLAETMRDQIRAHLDYIGPPTGTGADFTNRINCEWDEMAPATAGDFYIMIFPAGVEAGDAYGDGGTIDEVYRLDISIALRAPRKPRDRQRNLWLDTTRSFGYHEKRIREQIDFSYTAMQAVNTAMVADGEASAANADCDWFIEPLRFLSRDRIRPAPAEVFAGTPGETTAALIRTIHYGGARRMIVR